MGDRTAVIRAMATVNGSPATRDLTVTFGNGPLSVFNGAPSDSPAQWALAASSVMTTWSYDGVNFPGPYTCYPNTLENTNATTSGANIFFGAGWIDETIGGEHVGYPVGSKMPTVDQLAAVARQSGSSNSGHIPCKGAAVAAGWDVGSYYWTGHLGWMTSSDFFAYAVNINSGNFYGNQTLTNARTICVN